MKHELTRLYIPSVDKREDHIDYYIHRSLIQVLLDIFGDDVIHMVMKEGSNTSRLTKERLRPYIPKQNQHHPQRD
ncbi:hypothetical protein [Alkalibacillus salilacus]|uniref:Uncharacterized protein n=1 Tax=Alkalibacillus salilacus TaxID=284582 RepID=A0ABT9VIS7_9BACI|nr:hypothetical protein [Alkalibacillus salilacus]MDQ0160876.1 hypothetical protein [Alkalibacillus salilacus]